jgi:hypothetical protein
VSEVQTNTVQIETWKCENVVSSEALDNENVASNLNTNLVSNDTPDIEKDVSNVFFL